MIQYTDIGHNNPNDWIWMWTDGAIERLIAGTERTHERIWGTIDTENHWRGRFEVKTGYCSIAPPVGKERWNVPGALTELLKDQFPIARFYYFAEGVQDFSPNPKRKL